MVSSTPWMTNVSRECAEAARTIAYGTMSVANHRILVSQEEYATTILADALTRLDRMPAHAMMADPTLLKISVLVALVWGGRWTSVLSEQWFAKRLTPAMILGSVTPLQGYAAMLCPRAIPDVATMEIQRHEMMLVWMAFAWASQGQMCNQSS